MEELRLLLPEGGAFLAVGIVLSLLTTIALLVCLLLVFVVLELIGGDNDDMDRPFSNGMSLRFMVQVFLRGGSYGVLVEMLTRRERNRLYVGFRKYLLWGEERWLICHPGIAAHIFGAAKQWPRLSKEEAFKGVFLDPGPQRQAMLYTGTDHRWKTLRHSLTPFFYNTDFSALDDKMDQIISKHLQRVVEQQGGHAELLELVLTCTVDLLCQILFHAQLSDEDLDVLTKCMAECVVSKSAIKGTYSDGVDCMQYHMRLATEMAKTAPKETLAAIIRDSKTIPECLKEDNLAFFLEALTPASAAFWTICNILQEDGELSNVAQEDAVFRQQCIKESLRQYPPVPVLFTRKCPHDQTIPNPLYNSNKPKKKQSFLEKFLYGPPIENQPVIHVKKGTWVMLIPAVFHHDDRFWNMPFQFLPQRWDRDPYFFEDIKKSAKISQRGRQSAFPGLVGHKTSILGSKDGAVIQVEADLGKLTKCGIRSRMFGTQHEQNQLEAMMDHVTERTQDNILEHQKFSYWPFGGGQHACMGRRLALHMVDALVSNILDHKARFYKGVIPSLFSRKPWYKRTVATAAAYNFPADPVFITLKKPNDANDTRGSRIGFLPINIKP